ncbi:deoxyribonuclease [Legionella sp. km535]|uniref:endonuclease n=1 Tax=Legionella sp. km535 TaxID=2498107 RepID=UPI000F8D7B41|nr:endonuclease [Legionella sp. km535]RUR17671.1 deoxyribonuclease [Legionella sp. km535]
MFRFFISLFLVFMVLECEASPSNFSQAKKIAGEVFAQHPLTIYCGCEFHGKKIDLASCGMNEAQKNKRAHRVEWEHIMPAHQFGQHLECWRKPLCERNGKPYKGRACCKKISSQFRHMESELYNLWPAVGLVNGARSNYRISALASASDFYGCAIKLDKKEKKMEPSENSKGLVARAHLFFSERYNVRLSPAQKNLFLAWNKLHPPTAWEYQWAAQVALIEGYENEYITQWS